MINPNRVGQIDETSPLVSVPSLPASEPDENSPIEVVLPYPVGGVPGGAPIRPGMGQVTL